MVCEQLERELCEAGIQETFRGRAWSSNCREWVYFACFLDRPAIRTRMELAECVKDHEHRGTHDGMEAGFVCNACQDAIMGVHSSEAGKVVVFR